MDDSRIAPLDLLRRSEQFARVPAKENGLVVGQSCSWDLRNYASGFVLVSHLQDRARRNDRRADGATGLHVRSHYGHHGGHARHRAIGDPRRKHSACNL